MGHKKKPLINIPPEQGKHFSVPVRPATPLVQQRPSFVLECCHKRDFCFIQCDTAQKVGFADKLHELSQLTWNQIINANRQGIGQERIPELDRKKPSSVPKEAKIIGLKYHGNRRMAGFRDDNGTFHILWFNHNDKLYKH